LAQAVDSSAVFQFPPPAFVAEAVLHADGWAADAMFQIGQGAGSAGQPAATGPAPLMSGSGFGASSSTTGAPGAAGVGAWAGIAGGTSQTGGVGSAAQQDAKTQQLLGAGATGMAPAGASSAGWIAGSTSPVGVVGAAAQQDATTQQLLGTGVAGRHPAALSAGGIAGLTAPAGVVGSAQQQDARTQQLLGIGATGAAPAGDIATAPLDASTQQMLGAWSAGPTLGVSGAATSASAAGASTAAQQDFTTQQLLQGGGSASLGSPPTGTMTFSTGPASAGPPGAAGTGMGTFDASAAAVTAQQNSVTRALIGPSSAFSGAASGATSAAVARSEDEATRRLLGDSGNSGLRARGGASIGLSGHASRALERAEAEVTCFRLMLNGEISSAQLGAMSRGPLMCVFTVQHGADWTLVSGAPTGITQLACSSLPPAFSFSSALFRGGESHEVVWNFPIGLVFKSTSPFGWPRIVVTVYGTDLCNRRVVKGYGSVHVPCQPGRHSRTIRLYCPLSSSPLTRILGALFGNPAQLVDPRIVAGTEGREVVRVQSGGKVKVRFDVMLRDTEPFNYTF